MFEVSWTESTRPGTGPRNLRPSPGPSNIDSGREIADDVRRLVLAFERCGHDLIEGNLHAVELELAHQIKDFGSVH